MRIYVFIQQMKKALLFLSAFLCTGILGWSQQESPYMSNQRFRAGPIVGLNFSQVDGDADAGIHKLGLNAGFSSYVSMTERVGLQLDLLFSQKGSRYTRESPSTAGPYIMVYQLKLNYIEIPLAFQYYFKPEWHIGLGGSFNRLIGTNESWRSLFGWRDLDPEVYKFENNVWEGFVSSSYRITDGILVEARYQRSITSLRKGINTHQDFQSGNGQFNNFFSLRLAYYL